MRINEKDFTGDIIKKIPVLPRGVSNKGKKESFLYKNVICAFDIETTRYKTGEKKYISDGEIKDKEVAIMYIWQFQIGKNLTIFGRTWEEFKDLITQIDIALKDNERLLVYVHNLSYEWNWLHDEYILGSSLDEDSVFLLESRKVLKFLSNSDKIEFRCSYIHSNMSLDEFTNKMQVEHKKLSGIEYDYDKQRFPWTEMTEKELQYCENDVIGLVECIYKEMEVDKDTLYTIPLTSTGYVRREIKAAKKQLPFNYFENMQPDFHTYTMLREAFRGGNCHASRWYSNHSLHGRIGSADRSSSYPDVQLNCKFPVTKYMSPSAKEARNTAHMFELIENGRHVLARVAFHGVKLHYNLWGSPYLTKDKCRNIKGSKEYPIIYDNGRIVQCAYCETTVIDIDLKIILSSYGGEYDIDRIDVIEYQFARYGEMPEPIKEVIRKFYRLKTELKGDELQAVLYVKSKNKLNAVYGNSAQDPGKINTIYSSLFDDGDLYKEGYKNRKTGERDYILKPDRDKLKEFEDNKDNDGLDKYIAEIREHNEHIKEECYEDGGITLPYQYGVVTTAWARYYLELAIRECGTSFIYCDTDSVYYDLDGEPVDFTEYNKARIEASTKNNAYAVDANGKTHYMGVMEIEHGDSEDTIITDFKTLGAKKYAWIDNKHGLNITIAGVSKKYGKEELLEYCKEHNIKNPLDALTPGFIFRKSGGNEVEYIDKSPGLMNIDGREIYVPSCAVIRPSTYQVTLQGDYSLLLDRIADELEQYRKDGVIDIFSSLLFAYPLDNRQKM